MAIQTSFQIDHNHAYNGMIADGQLQNIVSRLNIDDETIGFGIPVWGEGTAKASDDMFVGITVREIHNRNYFEGSKAGFAPGDTMSVLNSGVMWIQLDEGVTVKAGDKVAFDTATGKYVADVADGVELEGAEWLTDSDAKGFAKLRITIGA